jgi:hypothetical protein
MTYYINRKGLAYCAGLYEGEGGTYLQYSPNFHSCTVRLMIAMTDLEPLQKFKNVVVFGSITGPINHSRSTLGKEFKPHYNYLITGYETVQHVCAMLWTELSPRRKNQIKICLTGYREFKKSPRYTAKDRKDIIKLLKYDTCEVIAEDYNLPIRYVQYLERKGG